MNVGESGETTRVVWLIKRSDVIRSQTSLQHLFPPDSFMLLHLFVCLFLGMSIQSKIVKHETSRSFARPTVAFWILSRIQTFTQLFRPWLIATGSQVKAAENGWLRSSKAWCIVKLYQLRFFQGSIVLIARESNEDMFQENIRKRSAGKSYFVV